MANLSLLEQFEKLGYIFDFVDDGPEHFGFNSKRYSNTIITIEYANYRSNSILRYKATYPNKIGYCSGKINEMVEALRDNHGIVPEFPTKGVHDDSGI